MSDFIKCPACGKPFSLSFEITGVLVWCSNNECKNIVADNGLRGMSGASTAKKLADLVKADLSKTPEHHAPLTPNEIEHEKADNRRKDEP